MRAVVHLSLCITTAKKKVIMEEMLGFLRNQYGTTVPASELLAQSSAASSNATYYFLPSSSHSDSPSAAACVPDLTGLVCKRIQSSFEPDPRDGAEHWNLTILAKSATPCFGSHSPCVEDGGERSLPLLPIAHPPGVSV